MIRDPLDSRDRIFVASGKPIPLRVSHAGHLFKIEDQQATGSCVWQTASSAVELLAKKYKPAKAVELSALFGYYNALEKQGRMVDAGTSLRDWCKILKNTGLCHESMWPFDPAKVLVKPPPACYQAAKKWRIKSYERAPDLPTMTAALAAGLPVMFSLNLRRAFAYEINGKSLDEQATYLRTRLDSPLFGWHEMLMVGYDDEKRYVIGANSWSESFGLRGLFALPYEMVERDFGDAWVITGLRNWIDDIADVFKGWIK